MATRGTLEPLNIPVTVNPSMLTEGDTDLVVGLTMPTLRTYLVHLHRLLLSPNDINRLRLLLIIARNLHDAGVHLIATFLAMIPLWRLFHK